MLKFPYTELIVWQKSMKLIDQTYNIASQFPSHELFGLRSQICKAAVSIASNIAEGSQRNTKKDFSQFLFIARGSLAEWETQMRIAYNRSYVQRDEFSEAMMAAQEIGKMLRSLHQKLY